MNFRKALILLILLFPFYGSGNSREGLIPVMILEGKRYVSAYDLRAFFPMESSYDIILQRGKLYHQSHVAIFKTGHCYVLVDGSLYRDDYPVRRENGEILFPAHLAIKIAEIFHTGVEITEKDGGLSVTRKGEEKKSGDTGAPDKKPMAGDRSGAKATDKPAEPIGFIILDAGHGGRDPGAIGRGGLREKIITLNIVRYLESSLKKKVKGIPIYLTRSNDSFIELSQRTEIANSRLRKKVNGIFVSVHVNASVSDRISGFETYFLSQNPSNEDARNTAALENNVIVLEERGNRKKYGDIEYIEARMMTTQIQKESSMLARSIQGAMARRIRRFQSRGVRKADFYVLRGSLMPAVLVETGYITNAAEAKYLKKSSHQKDLANGIADGIISFIRQYNRGISGY